MNSDFVGPPSGTEDYADLDIHLERLEPDSPEFCPVSLREIVDYLDMEWGCAPSPENLHFIRTASLEVGDRSGKVWLWRFLESDSSPVNVWVLLEGEEATIGAVPPAGLMTDEAFIIYWFVASGEPNFASKPP